MKLLNLFIKLKKIMSNDHEDNWIKAISDMIFVLTPPHYGGLNSEKDALQYIVRNYQSIVAGNGSFSDYFIWKSDYDERVLANQELAEIKAQIWKIVEELRDKGY